MDYLKNTLKFLGFDEGLNTQLEKEMTEAGSLVQSLDASTEFGTDKMQAGDSGLGHTEKRWQRGLFL
jgi:hypothetical protein